MLLETRKPLRLVQLALPLLRLRAVLNPNVSRQIVYSACVSQLVNDRSGQSKHLNSSLTQAIRSRGYLSCKSRTDERIQSEEPSYHGKHFAMPKCPKNITCFSALTVVVRLSPMSARGLLRGALALLGLTIIPGAERRRSSSGVFLRCDLLETFAMDLLGLSESNR